MLWWFLPGCSGQKSPHSRWPANKGSGRNQIAGEDRGEHNYGLECNCVLSFCKDEWFLIARRDVSVKPEMMQHCFIWCFAGFISRFVFTFCPLKLFNGTVDWQHPIKGFQLYRVGVNAAATSCRQRLSMVHVNSCKYVCEVG